MAESLRPFDGAAAAVPAGVADLIGHTPLLRLSRYLARDDIALYAKLEAFNPGGSAKDRPRATWVSALPRSVAITVSP